MPASPGAPDDATQTQSVGAEGAAGTQSGMPMGLTREQVRQDLDQARKSGDLDRVNQLYRGQ